MIAAGLKAAETRKANEHQEIIMELGAAVCQGCGSETSIPRTQTQGMPIMACRQCRTDSAPIRSNLRLRAGSAKKVRRR